MPAKPCPQLVELSAFRGGQLTLDQHLAVAKHIKRCSACAQLAATIPVPNEDTTEDPGQTLVNLSDTVISEKPLSHLGPYQLLRVLGRGGMGVVYEAEHVRLKNRVAVKLLSRPTLSDPTAVERFRREWEAVGRLDHPNVVRALHADEIDGQPFLAMELIHGHDLSKVVSRTGPMSIADAAELIRQAACGLAHAHAQQVIHRDVKPTNLLLTPNGVVKLLDLGLARFSSTLDSFTSASSLLGTADYMAPEQWDGSPTDARTDVYALGCVLYFLLTGKPPFSGPNFDSPRAKMYGHLTAFVDTTGLPPPLVTLLESLMAKRPSERPATAALVAEQLAPFAVRHRLDKLSTAAEMPTLDAFNDGEQTQPVIVSSKPVGMSRGWRRLVNTLTTRLRRTPPAHP